jgi:hypothetical protein
MSGNRGVVYTGPGKVEIADLDYSEAGANALT